MKRNGGLTLSSILQVPLTKYSSLQDLGDIRQLIVCFNDTSRRIYSFLHIQVLDQALQDVVKETEVWAQQYEADGRYRDAAYLYGRVHSDLKEESRIVPTLAAVYEKMGDYPAAELAQEKLMRTMLANRWLSTNEEQVREVETLSRLLNLFHTRLQVLGPASQTYAKLSIVYRAAGLDIEHLNAALLDQGLIVLDYLDQLGTSFLHVAVKNNAPNLARLLLQKGANLDLKDNCGETPLHIAVKNGTEEMVKLLLDWDADTEIKDTRGSTPIQTASLRGKNESIPLLLIERRADAETRDCRGLTPLGNAIESDSPSSAQILIRHGANVNATSSDFSSTLLCKAVREKKEWAVKMLLEKGANSQTIDSKGRQALYYAVEAGQELMVKWLLSYGGMKKGIAKPVSFRKTSTLDCAVRGSNLSIVEMVLKAGADTNEQDFLGNTPLHESITFARTHLAQIVGLLLNFGAQVNIANNRAETPLHLAVWLRQSEVVPILLDAGADPHLVDYFGETALSKAHHWSLYPYNPSPRDKEILQMLETHTNRLFANTNEEASS